MTTPTNVNTEAVNASLLGTQASNTYLIDPDTGQPYDSSHPIPINTNANGQSTMSASAPVTLASNQTPLVMSTPTVTQVASSITSGALSASNGSRKGWMIFNDSTAILYLLYGSGTASSTNYSVKIPAQSLFEMPTNPVYTGALSGVWASANGFAYVTEVV